MYELTIVGVGVDIKTKSIVAKFKSVYDMEVYLEVNNLPELCLKALDELNQRGEVTCISHLSEKLMIVCSRKEEPHRLGWGRTNIT